MSASHWCGGLCSRPRCVLAVLKKTQKAATKADISKTAKKLQQAQKSSSSGHPPTVRSHRFLSKHDIPPGMHPVHWAQLRLDAWRKGKVFTQNIAAALSGAVASSRVSVPKPRVTLANFTIPKRAAAADKVLKYGTFLVSYYPSM